MNIQLNFEQLVHLVLQLPQEQAIELEKVLKIKLNHRPKKKKPTESDLTDFQKLLLSGPIMSAEEEQRFEENRHHINQLRTQPYDFFLN